jgi:integrase
MASIQPRGKNKWLVRVFLGRNAEGKMQFHDKVVRGNKKDASTYARDMETRRDLGLPLEQTNLTLGQFLDKWLEEAARPAVEENTFYDYREKLDRYVRPALGKIDLIKLKPLDVQALYNSLYQRGLSPRTIQYAHSVISMALRAAVGWQLIPVNPADYTKRPTREQKGEPGGEVGPKEIQVLNFAEAEKFLEAAKADRMGVLLTFALATGARPEEYFGLKWEDVNFEKGEVTIRRVVKHRPGKEGGGWYFSTPKTKKSRRTIRVTESMLQMLGEHKRKQLARRLKLGPKYQQNDLVFATAEGGPIMRRNLHRRHLTPVLEAAGLPTSLHLYCLRHTFATLTLASGIDAKEVSVMMGHSSVAFTMDRYQHVLPSMRDATSKRLEEMLFKRAGLPK